MPIPLPVRLMLLTSFASAALSGVMGCDQHSPSTCEPVPQKPPLITLGFWHAMALADQSLLLDLVNEYNRSHQDVQIIPQMVSAASLVRDFRAAVLAGYGPTIVLLHNHTIGELVDEQLLLPLDALVPPQDRTRLLPTAVEGGIVDDRQGVPHLYGLPMMFDTLALYYRKDLVDEPPADMETLLRVAHRLTSLWGRDRAAQSSSPSPSALPAEVPTATHTAPQMWGLAYTLSLDKTIGYLHAYGGYVFDQHGQLALGQGGRAGTERWLQWLQSLQHDPLVLAGRDDILIDSAVKAQQVAMVIDWAHALPTYQNLWGDHLGVAVLPAVQEQEPRPYVQSWLLCISAHTRSAAERKAALDFIFHLVSNESQKRLLASGKQPVLLNVVEEAEINGLNHIALVFREQAKRGQPMPNRPAIREGVRHELERMLVMVLRGLATPSEAITYADQALRGRWYSLTHSVFPSPLPTVPHEANQQP